MKSSLVFIFLSVFSHLAYSISLYQLEKKRYETELSKSETINEVEQFKKKIEINELIISEKKRTLAGFLKADHQLKQFEFGGLLAIEKPTELDRNMKIFEILKAHNLNSLRELKYFSEELFRQKKELVQKVKQLEVLSQEIMKQESELKIAEKEALKKIIQEKENSLLRTKGYLSHPSPLAKLKSQFGLLIDPKNKFSEFNKGLLYSIILGQPVRAVGPGKIIFRDEIKYWGESIIIQHPGEYYSVYTQLKNCRVTVGQDVQQEEPLCEANKNEFYFELRNQSIAINPLTWMRN